MKPTDRSYAVDRTEEEWKSTLSPDEYQVLRRAGTERPYTGEYTDAKTVGAMVHQALEAAEAVAEDMPRSLDDWAQFDFVAGAGGNWMAPPLTRRNGQWPSPRNRHVRNAAIATFATTSPAVMALGRSTSS